MPYETGTASSPADLLQKIGTFISSHGWTIDSSVVAGYWDGTGGPGWRLHAHRGVVYVNLRAAVNESYESAVHADTTIVGFRASPAYRYSGIDISVGTGYNGANLWRDQPGVPVGCTNLWPVGSGMQLPQGAISWYHFFADATGDNIIVVVEKTAGVFTHLFWGTSLKKLGTWTGGPYFGAAIHGYSVGADPNTAHHGLLWSAVCPGTNSTSWSSAFCVRIDVDTWIGKWASNADGSVGYDAYGYTGWRLLSCATFDISCHSNVPEYGEMLKRLTSSMSGQSVFLPIRILAERNAVSSGEWSFIGTIPNIFCSNACDKGFAPAGLYSWGSDQYRVFPGPVNATHLGYAVKVV